MKILLQLCLSLIISVSLNANETITSKDSQIDSLEREVEFLKNQAELRLKELSTQRSIIHNLNGIIKAQKEELETLRLLIKDFQEDSLLDENMKCRFQGYSKGELFMFSTEKNESAQELLERCMRSGHELEICQRNLSCEEVFQE